MAHDPERPVKRASRSRRRADGSLRPSYRRYRARKRRERQTDEQRAERRAWLDNFEPGARTRFFKLADAKQAIWLRAFGRELDLPEKEAAHQLEDLGSKYKWMKLRTKSGMVVGIAPPRNRPERGNPKIHVPPVEA